MKNKYRFLCILGAVLLAGCNGDRPAETNGGGRAGLRAKSNRVVAVAYPLAYMTERLLEDTDVTVEFPGAEADNPGTWQPPESEVAGMQSADLVVTNGPGVTYAQWLIRVTLSKNKTCVSAADLPTSDFITVNDHKIVHRHGPEGEHSHPYMVPYSWLDPSVAARQAKKIAADLTKTYPDHEETINSNLVSMTDDLNTLAAELDKFKVKESQLTVMSANPDLKFFSRAAGLNDIHLLWLEEVPEQPLAAVEAKLAPPAVSDETSEQPEPNWAIAGGKRVMLWPLTLGTAPEIEGWYLVEVDLLDKQPEGGDYLSGMNANIKRLSDSINQ